MGIQDARLLDAIEYHDQEAAAALRWAAQLAEDEDVRRHLGFFADDHDERVRALGELSEHIEWPTGEPPGNAKQLAEERRAAVEKAKTWAEAAEALIAFERHVHDAWLTAAQAGLGREAIAIAVKAAGDERRHVDFLARHIPTKSSR